MIKKIILGFLTVIILSFSLLAADGSAQENDSGVLNETLNETVSDSAATGDSDNTSTISLNATSENNENDNAGNSENTSISPNETETRQKSITNNLQYKTDSTYDIDNNGYESTTGVIDFTVDNSAFSWDANKTNICTRWNVYSVESRESTTLCYGNSKCCNFVDLEPTRDNWDAPFYSVYGQYGSGLSTIVSAQILYVDYSVSPDSPYAEIYNSDLQDKCQLSYIFPLETARYISEL